MHRYQPRSWSGVLVGLTFLILAACGGNSGNASSPTPTATGVVRKDVFFTTQDHVKLAGWLYGTGTTAIICSHETAGDKSNWYQAAPWFAAHGFMVLAFDFRGYGDSEGFLDRSKLDKDVQAAIAFVQRLGTQKIILLGASLGAIISLIVAATKPVAGVISLSGGYYRNQAPPTLTRDEVRAITAPKLFIATQNDVWVNETLAVYQDALPPKELHIYPGTGHGTSIFDTENGPDLLSRILTFIRQALSGLI